ncbi:MAG: indolepyruvate ferredoxin oxidoreductase family protein [Caldimonas sp.]
MSLEDKYTWPEGWVYMTGIQALVRLPIQQRIRDEAAGLNTGGYVSGYRGSPLGRYDMELEQADAHLKARNIVFRPGLNEDLAATAIWGAQHVGNFPGAKVDGVFGIWYGKGPGVDRSGDVLRHANLAGTSRKGGVVCIAGDDHGAKSSTVANFSDPVFMAVGMPVLYPSNTQELLDYGLHAIAMSRFSGCWIGMKAATDVVEGGGSVYVSPSHPAINLPDADAEESRSIRVFDPPLVQERRLYDDKIHAALRYAQVNSINAIVEEAPEAEVGVISAGKAWQDTLQALSGLATGGDRVAAQEIRLLKIGMVWPLDPEIVRRFARGLKRIVVVEEKRPILEDQVRAILYGTNDAPELIGKYRSFGIFDAQRGPAAFQNWGELSPASIAPVLLSALGQPSGGQSAPVLARPRNFPVRPPSFCSGCPHNRSTKVIEGSRALAGIGCHAMATLQDPANTNSISHMGGEGVMWLGQQPFTDEKHVFTNLGDGTYSHSGFLAIRQALAAKVPITYKLLYNGFVSMTGGQAVESGQTPSQILGALAAEGVTKMAVVTDEPERYAGVTLPPGVPVHHRTRMEAVQKEFRDFPGVSVILYDQPCATERRRLRKRGKWSDPSRRTFINAAVCEGCGDCGTVSNCMSIEPVETPLGRKRRINQASCNKDFSCVEGFCPSFVTVHGGKLRRQKTAERLGSALTVQEVLSRLPMPTVPALERTYSILVGGIGGTGVVTVGQTLAVAAHVDGYFSSNLDITGLAQKYGAVGSHVRIAPEAGGLHATRIAAGELDLLIGCDLVVAAGEESMSKLAPGRTVAVVSNDLAPTAAFARDPDWYLDAASLEASMREVLGARALFLNAQKVAAALVGDPIGANMFLLGAAWQRGHVPLSLESVLRAIELNAVAVDMNKAAFTWGRFAAHDPRGVAELVEPASTQVIKVVPVSRDRFEDIFRDRSARLREYGGEHLVRRYQALVNQVHAAERAAGLDDRLSAAVAHNYHRLLAFKDEWEVARLYASADFEKDLRREFEGEFTLHFHLGAWPFARRDKATGKVLKRDLGPWVLPAFRLMSRLRSLRNTWLDPFRRNEERRFNDSLVATYESDLTSVLKRLDDGCVKVAVRLAAWPQKVRGFGHVRIRQWNAGQTERRQLLAELGRAGALIQEVQS